MESPSIESLDLCTEEKDLWVLKDSILSPTPTYTRMLNMHLSSNAKDDPVFYFLFAPHFAKPGVTINKSRLEWAGGPLKALATSKFKENASNKVHLTEIESAEAYSVLRDYLYGAEIDLTAVNSFDSAINVVRSAHRWGLMGLVYHISLFIKHRDMLSEFSSFVKYVDDAALQEDLQFYFWSSIGKYFKHFGAMNAIQTETSNGLIYFKPNSNRRCVETEFCPNFPRLWECALQQNMEEVLVYSLLWYAHDIEEKILDVILEYLEPRVDNDDAILRMIRMTFDMTPEVIDSFLSRNSQNVVCSARAVYLLAKCVTYPFGFESKLVWQLPVHTLLGNGSLGGGLPLQINYFGNSKCSFEFSLSWGQPNKGPSEIILLSWKKKGSGTSDLKLMILNSLWCCAGKSRAACASRTTCLASNCWSAKDLEGTHGILRVALRKKLIRDTLDLHSHECESCGLRVVLFVNQHSSANSSLLPNS